MLGGYQSPQSYNYCAERQITENGTRKRKSWSVEEAVAMEEGKEKYKDSNDRWKMIKTDPDFADVLKFRTSVDLKDRDRCVLRDISRDSACFARDGRAYAVKGDKNVLLRTCWSDEEINALLEGFERHRTAFTKWKDIKADPDFAAILKHRSNMDLKDKHRLITRRGQIM